MRTIDLLQTQTRSCRLRNTWEKGRHELHVWVAAIPPLASTACALENVLGGVLIPFEVLHAGVADPTVGVFSVQRTAMGPVVLTLLHESVGRGLVHTCLPPDKLLLVT